MSDGISIKMESIIKLEPEMLLFSNEFRSPKEETNNADGEDSVVVDSSDEISTDTGSNPGSVLYIPFPFTNVNEDSGHEGTPDYLGNGINSNGDIIIENTVCTGDRGNVSSWNEESKKGNPEVCIIEERVCKGHWRDGNGRVARTRCTCCYMCSMCGTSILRRRDFLQHMQSHMAERQSDRWRLQVKRVRQDRSVRPARATPKGPAGRMSPKSVARCQPPTKPVAKGRVRGGGLSVPLSDEAESESTEADGDVPPQRQLPTHVAGSALQTPCARKVELKELRVVLKRLIQENPSVAKPPVAKGVKTSEKVLLEKQPHSHKQAEAGGRLSHIAPADPNASTTMEEMSKTQPLSHSQDESGVVTVRKCLGSESTLSSKDTVTEDSTTTQPQSQAQTGMGGQILRESHATKCVTFYAEAKNMQPQSHAQTVVGSRVLRKSHATTCTTYNGTHAKKKRPEPYKKAAIPESHVEPEGCMNELTGEERLANKEPSEEILSKKTGQLQITHKETLLQGFKDNGSASNDIHGNRFPQLVVRLESKDLMVAGKSQADGTTKAAETQEKSVSKTQTYHSVPRRTIRKSLRRFSSDTAKQRSQRARTLQCNKCASNGETSSTAHQLKKQKIGALCKPQTVSSTVSKEPALMRTRFQSQRTSVNHQLQQVAREDHTYLGEKVEGNSETFGDVVTPTESHTLATGIGRKSLKRLASDSCDVSNAVAEEEPLPKSRRLLARKVIGMRRTLKGQNSLSEGSGKSKKNAPSKAQRQLLAKTSGVLATRKKHACDDRVTVNEQESLKLHKATDATERTCPIRTRKAAKDLSNNVAVNEDVLPKTQPQPQGHSVTTRRSSKARDIAPSNADSELKLVVLLDSGERAVVAQQSQASDGDSERREAADRPTKKVRTRLQSHMQADEEKRVFRCSYCKATFPDAVSLRPHVESHRYWEETFYCEICHRRFSGRGYLAVHMNAHTKEKPFACDLCDRRFALRSYLALHVRSHVKPFGCGACGERFARARSLHGHVRSHANGAGGKRRRKIQ